MTAFPFGVTGGAFATSASPTELAREAERFGFQSLTFGEHTHIPVNLRPNAAAPPPQMIRIFASQFDPFVAMTAAAVVTTTLQVGTSVALIPEHHPIRMAKAISSLDQLSGGRLFLGIGAAWNEEVENHGVAFAQRWAYTREHILAMRAIWAAEQPEFHGAHINFDPIWCDPKPVQAGGPPILIGSNSRYAARRVAEYADGWIPTAASSEAIADGITALKTEAERQGRPFEQIRIEPVLFDATREGVASLIALGATKIHLGVTGVAPGAAAAKLEKLAELIEPFRKG